MKILIITANTFQRYSGGGILNINLFKDWPKDNLANIHKDVFQTDKEFCDKYFKLSNKEMGWGFPINILYNIYRLFFKKERNNKVNSIINKNDEIKKLKSIAKHLKRLISFFGLEGFGEKTEISKELKNFIDKFKPDVIYSSLGDLGYIKLIKKVSHLYDIPVIIHITDDWPNSSYRRGFSRIYRSEMEWELQELLETAVLRYTICDEMSRDYSIRYKLHFDAIINPIDSKEWLPFSKDNYSINNVFTVRYLGAIHPLVQKDGLIEVARAISELNEDGLKINFEIFTPIIFVKEIENEIQNYKSVSVKAAPPNTESPTLLSSADLLVIPVNFDKKSFRYNKYSLPSKTFAYMISGTPVLLYGPSETPHISYAKREGWGLVVENNNIEDLKLAIKKLFSDEHLRSKLGNLSKKLVVERHDGNKVREKLYSKIIETIINK